VGGLVSVEHIENHCKFFLWMHRSDTFYWNQVTGTSVKDCPVADFSNVDHWWKTCLEIILE
jgi:hypothetical protein